MGYQSLPITKGWHVFTPSFKSLDGDNDQYDIKKIYFTKEDGTEFTNKKGNVCKGAIAIQKINATGWFANAYKWYSNLNEEYKAWSVDGKTITTDVEELELCEAESFIINNNTGETVKMCVTGAVIENPIVAVEQNWSLMGNATPSEIDLSDIYFLMADGSPFTSKKGSVCKGAIAVQKVGDDGWFQTNYKWYSSLNEECKAWSTDGKNIMTDKVPLVAGESFAINNTTGAKVFMVLPSPIK